MKPILLLSASLLLAHGVALAHGVHPPAIDPAGLKRELKKRSGKPIVVHFWSAESASELAAIARLRAKGATVVTVAVDDKDRVAAALRKLPDAGDAFWNRAGEDFSPGYVRWLEPGLSDLDGAPLPRTYVLGRDGRVLKALSGKGAAARIAPLLK